MGVLRFFRYLTSKWEDCLIKLQGAIYACESAKSKGIEIDWLELDLNAIYHGVAQEVYHYGNGAILTVPVSLLSPAHNKPKVVAQASEQELFGAICSRIEELRIILQPRLGIYFSTDGVSGVSKQSQQKKRRFKTCLDAGNDTATRDGNKFDSNTISCGTLFMGRLETYMDTWIQGQMKTNSQWKNLTVIISSDRIVSEGEHKLLRHMRDNPAHSYAVVSPDADLIFLGLGLHNPKVWIFRENIFDDIAASFLLVDLSRFRQCVLRELGLEEQKSREALMTKYSLDDEGIIRKIVEDFISYLFFIGNDFLPQIPSLNVNNGAIELLFQAYLKIITDHGFITSRNSLGYHFHRGNLKALLGELAKLEYNMLVTNQKRNHTRWPDTILKKYLSYPISAEKLSTSGKPQRVLTIELEGYKKEYYEQKFKGVDVKVVVHEYLKGMLFVLRYYLEAIPSFEWSYPFHYAPFFAELAEHIETFDTEQLFPPSIPLTPLEQLVAILPGKSAHLLPEPLRTLSTSPSSPLIDMFPVDFEVDLEGKKQEYEGVVCLPHVDVRRLRRAFRELEPKLGEENRARNQPGLLITYFHNSKGHLTRKKTKVQIPGIPSGENPQ